MKRLLTLALLVLFSSGVCVAKYTPKIRISKQTISENSKQVTISFDAYVDKVSSNYKLTLTPIVYRDLQSVSTKPIIVNGRTRAIMDQRIKKGENDDFKGDKKQLISYQTTIPYQNWMSTVSLKVQVKVKGCANSELFSVINVIPEENIYYDLVPSFDTVTVEPVFLEIEKLNKDASYLYPINAYVSGNEVFKKPREKDALTIYFTKSSSLIDSLYKDNGKTLTQIRKTIEYANGNNGIVLEKIALAGMSSPEGPKGLNDKLADQRAQSLKSYISAQGAANCDFELVSVPADWYGLTELVYSSTMPYRLAVLEVLNTYSDIKERESALRSLESGIPYEYIKKHFLPQLRGASYIKMYYDLIPDLDTQYINKAMVLLKESKYDQALTLLLSVKSDRQLENSIGVCYMMLGNYTEAIRCFESAISKSNKDATSAEANLEQVRIKQSIKSN